MKTAIARCIDWFTRECMLPHRT